MIETIKKNAQNGIKEKKNEKSVGTINLVLCVSISSVRELTTTE